MNWKQSKEIDEMKEQYTTPVMEILEISEADVIRTSLEMPPIPFEE